MRLSHAILLALLAYASISHNTLKKDYEALKEKFTAVTTEK